MTEVQLRTLLEHGTPVQLTAMPRPLDLPGYTLAIDTGQVVRQELVSQRGGLFKTAGFDHQWRATKMFMNTGVTSKQFLGVFAGAMAMFLVPVSYWVSFLGAIVWIVVMAWKQIRHNIDSGLIK